jgi:hypothetical protein
MAGSSCESFFPMALSFFLNAFRPSCYLFFFFSLDMASRARI